MSSEVSQHEGWLWKWTNYLSGYQKRWFVLSNGVLTYYMSKDDISSGCRGSVSLYTAGIFKENSNSFRIEVEDTSSSYYLRTNDKDDCDTWLKVLTTAKADSQRDRMMERQRQEHEKVIAAMFGPMETKLDELKLSRDVAEKHANTLIRSLTEFDKATSSESEASHASGNDDATNLKVVNESVILFRATSTAMVSTCSEFVALAKKQTSEWSKLLERERITNNLMNQDEGQPFPDLTAFSDDDDFVDASDIPTAKEGPSITAKNEESTKSLACAQLKTNNDILVNSKHRSVIPFKQDYRLNLWTVLKHCIGKDISKLPVPVNFNEPLSILQRLSEELEYSKLLDKAALCADSTEQMAYVAVFSASTYSTTAHRTGKPFNPLLGETFELDCMEELGFRLIGEQVTHHPPRAALHIESSKNRGHGGWTYWHDATPESRFRGNYLTLTPVGTCHILFHDSGNHITWKKVDITVNNIILGKLWMEQSGESVFVNHTTGDTCNLKFWKYSYFDKTSFRKVSGVVKNKSGAECYTLSGTWDKMLKVQKLSSENTPGTVIWEVNSLPPQADKMYNFTRFAILLNEPTDGTAPTDSRLRPDQRKMEEALYDDANSIKLELEERQRARRRQREKLEENRKKQRLPNAPYQPMWFSKKKCPLTGTEGYVYNHEYWEAKEKQDWSRCTDIFDISGKAYSGDPGKNWPDLVKSARIHGPADS